MSEQHGSSSGGLRLGSGRTSSLAAYAAYAVEATDCPSQHPPCLFQPPLLLLGQNRRQLAGVGKVLCLLQQRSAVNEEFFLCVLVIFQKGMFRQL